MEEDGEDTLSPKKRSKIQIKRYKYNRRPDSRFTRNCIEYVLKQKRKVVEKF